MKFIYTAGQYTQFMGRMFAFGQPQEVSDNATIAALRKRSDFKEVKDGQEQIQAPAPAAVLASSNKFIDCAVEKRPILGLRKR